MGKVFTIADGLENMGPLRTGGQGSVYKGRRMGEIFSAVKLLPTPVCSENCDDKNFQDFQNEVLKLKKVNEEPNPNVVKILSSGLTDSSGFPYIEMEYIEGPDLEELIKPPHDSVFSIKEVINVADQLAAALAHCHKAGVKHGDIKSNNIKLNIKSGNYVLLDFGLAIMSDEQRRTSLRYAGAIEFMAPEQSEGSLLFQSDIYSFGIVIYELLGGRVPFPLYGNGETARNTVMISHMESPVPDILALRRQNLPEGWTEEKKTQEMLVPAWLLEVMGKCLEKDPENRYRDGLDLYEAIIRNSTLPEPEQTVVNAALLQNENGRLHSLVMKYRNKLNEQDMTISSIKQQIAVVNSEMDTYGTLSGSYLAHKGVHLSKAAFILLLVSTLLISAFSGHAIFSDKKQNNVVSAPDTSVSRENKAPTFYKASLPEPQADEEKAQTPEPSPDKSNIDHSVVTKPAKRNSELLPSEDSKRSLRKKLREQRQEKKAKERKGKFIEIQFY